MHFSDDENKSEVAETTKEILEGKQNPLMVDLVTRPDRVKDTIDRWFDKEDFSNEQNDEDLELDLLAERYEKNVTAKSGENKKIFNSVYLLCLFLFFINIFF